MCKLLVTIGTKTSFDTGTGIFSRVKNKIGTLYCIPVSSTVCKDVKYKRYKYCNYSWNIKTENFFKIYIKHFFSKKNPLQFGETRNFSRELQVLFSELPYNTIFTNFLYLKNIWNIKYVKHFSQVWHNKTVKKYLYLVAKLFNLI